MVLKVNLREGDKGGIGNGGSGDDGSEGDVSHTAIANNGDSSTVDGTELPLGWYICQ